MMDDIYGQTSNDMPPIGSSIVQKQSQHVKKAGCMQCWTVAPITGSLVNHTMKQPYGIMVVYNHEED